MRAGRSLNFILIGPPTAELAALAGNDNTHESLDEFEVWLDLTTGFHGNR